MSRCDKEAIFSDYVGNPFQLIAKCPICDSKIKKDAIQGSLWAFEKGHIFPMSKGGPDVYTNLIPLCRSCNRSMGSKNFWDYKLEKGKISPEEARASYIQTKELINKFDPICEEIQQNGSRCTNRKFGYIHNWCKSHIPNHIDYMDVVFE